MRIPNRSTCVRSGRNFRFCVIGLALAGLLAAVRSAQAEEIILYSDNFNGSVLDDLAGTTPDTTIGSNTWQGNAGFKADGSVSNVEGGIYLPFAATSGKVYTLTVSFLTDGSSAGWIGAGFGGGTADSESPLNDNAGRGWVIVQNGDKSYQSFIGPGTDNGETTLIVDPANQVSTLTVTLDARSANAEDWTFSSTLQVNTTNYTVWAKVNANVNSASQITAVGLSAFGGTGQFTSFTVVPEPSTYVLGVLASAFVVSLSRFRKRTALAG